MMSARNRGDSPVLLPALRSRKRISELMDDPGLDPVEHIHALRGLARINRFSRSVGILWPTIRKLSQILSRPVRLLDVATGSGDVPSGLLSKASRSLLTLDIAGCDISPVAIAAAANTCPGARFFVHDVLKDPLPGGFDIVTCSLFLHHLSNDEAVLLLQRLKQATNHTVLVNDLARSLFNYLSVKVACNVLSRSRVVRFDGPASVLSAFTPSEALALAEKAGLKGVSVQARFPCRFLLSWGKC
jgi:SAM-dependent methyltransferase